MYAAEYPSRSSSAKKFRITGTCISLAFSDPNSRSIRFRRKRKQLRVYLSELWQLFTFEPLASTPVEPPGPVVPVGLLPVSRVGLRSVRMAFSKRIAGEAE